MHRDPAYIRRSHRARLRVAVRRHDVDKGFSRETPFEQRLHVGARIGQACVERGMNAADHRREMGRENKCDRRCGTTIESLHNLRMVTMPGDVIGLEVIRCLGKHESQLVFASGPGYA